MTPRVSITRVEEKNRQTMDNIAAAYFTEILPDGPRYFPAALDRYWIENGRHPYLIHLDDEPIGFALIWNHIDGTHELAEFTILPAYRHKGIGTEAAQLIFNTLGGDWTLGVAAGAPGGMKFWAKCLAACEDACEIVAGPPKTAQQVGRYSFRIQR